MITPWDFKFAKKKRILCICSEFKHQMKKKKLNEKENRRHQFRYEKELVICV